MYYGFENNFPTFEFEVICYKKFYVIHSERVLSR